MMKSLLIKFIAAASASTLFSAMNVQAAFSDVSDDYSYKKAVTVLDELNIMDGYEDGTFAPDKDITRAELTKLLVCLLGYGDTSETTAQFADLSETHWANSYIAAAYGLGIINGYSDTEFGPDDPVTYEQALKMTVYVLGYQDYAEAQGGYSNGYIAEAISLKLNDGITETAYEANASRGVVAQIMYNALGADDTKFPESMLVYTSLSEDNFNFLSNGDVVLAGGSGDNGLGASMQVQDYDEIKSVLSGELTTVSDSEGNEKKVYFDWTAVQEQTEDNNWQKYKFDFRYPKEDVTDLDSYWVTGGNNTDISSRVFMCNVLQVLASDNIICVTAEGFGEDGSNPENYTEIKVSDSTKYVRYDSQEKEFTPYAAGTISLRLALSNLKCIKNYGDGCSKILVAYASESNDDSEAIPTAKLIVIYQ